MTTFRRPPPALDVPVGLLTMSSRGKVRSRTERKAPLARRDSPWCLSHEVGARQGDPGAGARQPPAGPCRAPGPPGRDHRSLRGPLVPAVQPSASISPWRSSLSMPRLSSCAAGSSGLTTAERCFAMGFAASDSGRRAPYSFATRSRPRWLTVVRGVHWPTYASQLLVGRPIAPERQPQSCTSSPYCEAVDFSVLGPLRVEDANGPIEIRGGKERLLLARLVAASGRLVTTSDLIDTMWARRSAGQRRQVGTRPSSCGCATRWSQTAAARQPCCSPRVRATGSLSRRVRSTPSASPISRRSGTAPSPTGARRARAAR